MTTVYVVHWHMLPDRLRNTRSHHSQLHAPTNAMQSLHSSLPSALRSSPMSSYYHVLVLRLSSATGRMGSKSSERGRRRTSFPWSLTIFLLLNYSWLLLPAHLPLNTIRNIKSMLLLAICKGLSRRRDFSLLQAFAREAHTLLSIYTS